MCKSPALAFLKFNTYVIVNVVTGLINSRDEGQLLKQRTLNAPTICSLVRSSQSVNY